VLRQDYPPATHKRPISARPCRPIARISTGPYGDSSGGRLAHHGPEFAAWRAWPAARTWCSASPCRSVRKGEAAGTAVVSAVRPHSSAAGRASASAPCAERSRPGATRTCRGLPIRPRPRRLRVFAGAAAGSAGRRDTHHRAGNRDGGGKRRLRTMPWPLLGRSPRRIFLHEVAT